MLFRSGVLVACQDDLVAPAFEIPITLDKASHFGGIANGEVLAVRAAEEPDMRRLRPDPCREEHRGQQAFHAAGRDVDQQAVYLALLLAIVNRHQVVAYGPDMPALRELTARLDHMPSLTDELNQTFLGGSFLEAEAQQPLG